MGRYRVEVYVEGHENLGTHERIAESDFLPRTDETYSPGHHISGDVTHVDHRHSIGGDTVPIVSVAISLGDFREEMPKLRWYGFVPAE